MTQQVIVLFEERMNKFHPVHFDTPVKTKTLLSDDFITRAKMDGRP